MKIKPKLIKDKSKQTLGISLIRVPSYYRLMHVHKSKCELFGVSWVKSMIKGPLAFLKLLLVRSFEALVLLLLLELPVVYRTRHIHTSKQVQKIRNSTPNNMNSRGRNCEKPKRSRAKT